MVYRRDSNLSYTPKHNFIRKDKTMSKSIYTQLIHFCIDKAKTCRNPDCNKKLIGKDQKKYCSKSCAAKVNNIGIVRNPRKPKKKCKNDLCEQLTNNPFYCSEKCANSCSNKRKRDSERKTKIPRKKCVVCGKLHINTMWCSKECYDSTRQCNFSYDKLFIENSTIKRGTIKKVIRRDNLKKYECEICNIGPIWNGKTMPLILDHINGINNDNRLENLRFVCSNCDTQLPTYKSKNRK